jgi:hypothetical protein
MDIYVKLPAELQLLVDRFIREAQLADHKQAMASTMLRIANGCRLKSAAHKLAAALPERRFQTFKSRTSERYDFEVELAHGALVCLTENQIRHYRVHGYALSDEITMLTSLRPSEIINQFVNF